MRYDRSRVDLEEVLPVKFLVNSARPSEKKAYPVRWLIVVLAGTGSLLLAALYATFRHQLQELKN
jgi:uncharacterized protein involved in exopolysaccharide biosynthesis